MSEDRYDSKRQTEWIGDFSRGLAMGISPGLVPPEASLWSINFETARGGLRSRKGRERVGNRLPAGSSTCYWLGQYRKRTGGGTTTDQTLRINSQDLFELVGSTWTFRGSVSAQRLTTGHQFVNRLWFGDGVVSGKVWDGSTIQEWSSGAPGLPLVYVSVAGVGGNLSDGDFQAVWTLYSTSTGEETNPSSSLAFTIVAGTDTALVTVTIPAVAGVPARFNKARIYRTARDEASPEYESEIAYAGVATNTTLGTRADADLGDTVEYDNTPVPKLQFFVEHESRFFGVTLDNPSTLRWSKTDLPWAWPAANSMNISLDDGDDITGLLPKFHGILNVFKRKQAYAVSPDPLFVYSNSAYPQDRGCLSHYSIVVVGNYAFAYDEKGFWHFNGAQFVAMTDMAMDFFLKARRNAQSLEAVAIHDDRSDRPYYRCVLEGPDPRDTTVSRTWWVSMLEQTGGISLVEGWSATVVARIEGSNRIPEVWSGDNLGAVYRHFEDASGNALWTDHNEDAVPQAIECDHRSPDMAIGAQQQVFPHHNKIAEGLFVELERSEGPTPTLALTSILDGVESSFHTVTGHTSGVITTAGYRRLGGTPCRRFGFRIHGTGTFDARVTGVGIEYTPVGMRLRGTV